MTTRRFLAVRMAALLLVPALGGCVALAGPLVGGAIAATAASSKGRVTVEEPAPVPTAAATADAPYEVVAGATALPAPLAAPPAPAPAAGALADLAAFAGEQLDRDPVLLPRLSAILREPSELDGFRTFCGVMPPAMIVDIDSAAGKAVAPSTLYGAEFAPALAKLREDGMAIAWLSDAPQTEAQDVRARLLADGLAEAAEDRLLLDTGQRKQLRRLALSETHCVVAILGTELGDFDELFDYLKDPAAAWQLEEMMGEGWFLLGDRPTGQAALANTEMETD